MVNVTSLQSLRHNDKTVRLHDGANVLPRALAKKATGRSVSSIASELDIPRTTLQDQLVAHDAIEIADAVKNAFVTSEGQEFLKRLDIAAHFCRCLQIHRCALVGRDFQLRKSQPPLKPPHY